MRILNRNDIMETIGMLTDENLDVRTVTMGISLLDCIDPDGEKACEKIYNKITRLAGSLVSTVDSISSEYGIPIVNKRISVTPIAMLLGAAPDADPVMYAKALDRAAKAVGVNFIGGFGALVHKGFSAGDRRLIQAIPRALAETDIVCSSVNIGSTKSGINMDAVKLMGEVVRETAELTKDNMCMGDAKLVAVLQCARGQPLHGGRVPRRGRAGLRDPRGRFRPRCGACCAGQAAEGRPDGRGGRAGQAHGVQDHPPGPAGGQPGQRASGRAGGHYRPVAGPDARPSATALRTFWKRWAWKAAAAAAPRPAWPC